MASAKAPAVHALTPVAPALLPPPPPPAPPQPPPPPSSSAPTASRYRTLRGKSVSSTRPFDIFRDSHSSASASANTSISLSTGTSDNDNRQHPGDRSSSSSPSSRTSAVSRRSNGSGSGNEVTATNDTSEPAADETPRRRSKSVNHLRQGLAAAWSARPLPAASSPAASAANLPPRLPSSPVLSPKPVNLSIKPSLKALDSLKAPIETAKETLWRAATINAGKKRNAPVATASPTRQDAELERELTAQHPALRADPPSPASACPQTRDQQQQEEAEPPATPREHKKPEPQASAVTTAPSPQSHHQSLPSRPTQPQGQQRQQASSSPPSRPVTSTSPCPKGRAPHPRGSAANEPAGGDAARVADEVARLEAETDRILAEQKKLDLARLHAALVTPPPKSKRSLLNLDKIGFLSLGRRSNAASSRPATPSTLTPSIFSPAFSHFSCGSSVDDSPLPLAMPTNIEPGGKGIVPQLDAPASASNGGERRVIVRCQSSTVALSVTEKTSVAHLQDAAQRTNHQIDPATCVLIECYFVLGLERRLRRYERVRDILNSWDRDQQNSLLILTDHHESSGGNDNRDLELTPACRSPDAPPGFCLYLSHSSRPGKWAKRWVTLLDNGQMFTSKKPDASASDRDSTSVCHLSDFDIYTPKESEMRRNLKPPKRFCYAIKSQQKTVVFPDGENFVHFFSTDDAKVAARFRELVHAWRSWYLASITALDAPADGAGKLQQTRSSPLVDRLGPARKDGHHHDARALRVSIDEAAYRSGEPLMDINDFKAPDIEFLTTRSAKPPPQEGTTDPAVRGHQPPPPPPPLLTTPQNREFSADGLLGDGYRRRQAALAQASSDQAQRSKADGPFTQAPSLNGGVAPGASSPTTAAAAAAADKPEPRPWLPSATEHTARIRSQSVNNCRRPVTADATAHTRRDKQQQQPPPPPPLLNFSHRDFPEPPCFRDAPSYSGRHHAGHPLINFATGVAGSVSRRGMSSSSNGEPMPPSPSPLQQQQQHQHQPQQPHHYHSGSRPRSRSIAGSISRSGSRRCGPDDPPPVPPLPHRSMRRDWRVEPSSRGSPTARHFKPLVNHAG